ncbi:MAG: HEAT repeat domain-containing protein [Candidatus Zixiibacteriota bacterium]
MAETSFQDNRIKDVSYILKDLLKVIKVVSLYPETNPLPQSMKRSFAEKLVSLVEQYGQITISVEKDSLLYEHEVVFQDRSKEESLAGVFFDAGITDFTFKDGLDVDDVYSLLEAIRVYVNSPYKTHDLASLIWEKEVNGFVFSTLEDVTLPEYNEDFNLQGYMRDRSSSSPSKSQFTTDRVESYYAIFDLKQEANVVDLDDSSPADRDQSGSVSETPTAHRQFYAVQPGEPGGTVLDGKGIDSVSFRTAEAAKAMGYDDVSPSKTQLPDTTMILNEEFKLSQEEEKNVSRLLCLDAEFDMYESTTELLKEMLLQEMEMNAFYETVTICERIITEFLLSGKLEKATYLLQFLKELEDKIRKEKPLWSERLKDARVMAGSRDRLKALATGLNDYPEVEQAELTKYLDNFGWEALSGITDLLGEFNHHHHRQALCDYLAKKGRNHSDVVAKGIYDRRWFVVRNSVVILAQIGDDISLNHLKHALNHEERRVRLELVQALKNCSNDKALELLKQAVMDSDREIRREAIDAIVSRSGPVAFDTIVALINDKDFPLLEPEDQQNLLRAFSILGGDAAVGFLARLILRFNLFRNTTLSFYRRAAFEALSYNRSEKAERLLVKLASSWRPDIRRQASAMLRRRREIIYGGQ